MVKNIFNTFLTYVGSTLLSFVIMLIVSNALGAEGKGITSIISVTAMLLFMITNLFSGTTLIYFVPRNSLTSLYIIATVWNVIVCGGYVVLSLWIPALSSPYTYSIGLIAVARSFSMMNSKIFLGQELVAKSNLITFLQVFLVVLILVFLFYVVGDKSIESCINASIYGHAIVALAGFIMLMPRFSFKNIENIPKLLKEMFNHGFYNQIDSIFIYLNNRMSFYLLNLFVGAIAVGIYSIAFSISEMILLFSNSVGGILFSKIANKRNKKYSLNRTVQLCRVSFIISLSGGLTVLFIPDFVFQWVFGNEFVGVTTIMYAMIPGIIGFSQVMVIQQYFSGVAMFKHNAISAVIGCVGVSVSGWLLIPVLTKIGAAMALSIGYLSIYAYLLAVISKDDRRFFTKSILLFEDFNLYKRLIK